MHDTLFNRKEKIGIEDRQKDAHDCACCLLNSFHTPEEIHYCEWCGTANCDECVYKSRAFPISDAEAVELKKQGKNPPAGSICKLCDRKILGKRMLGGLHDEVIALSNDAL